MSAKTENKPRRPTDSKQSRKRLRRVLLDYGRLRGETTIQYHAEWTRFFRPDSIPAVLVALAILRTSPGPLWRLAGATLGFALVRWMTVSIILRFRPGYTSPRFFTQSYAKLPSRASVDTLIDDLKMMRLGDLDEANYMYRYHLYSIVRMASSEEFLVGRGETLALISLNAMWRIGRSDAIGQVQTVLRQKHCQDKWPAIIARAEECLAALEERAAAGRNEDTLLRSAQRPNVEADLLRPAANTTESAEVLLRAGERGQE
jgi:hypothetical protein